MIGARRETPIFNFFGAPLPERELRLPQRSDAYLRLASRKDFRQVQEIFKRESDRLAICMPFAPTRCNIKGSVAQSVRGAQEGTALPYYLIDRQDPDTIKGSVKLSEIDKDAKIGFLAYWLVKDAQGRGLATDAARTLVHHAFDNLGIEVIFLRIDQTNESSQRVAGRLNAERTGGTEVLEDGRILEVWEISRE